ncbi:Streptothricin hydrolase [compost metagenome]
MTRRAVIAIDIQNEYFDTGKLPLVGIEAAASQARQVMDDARAKGDMVVHVRHEFSDPQAPFFTPGTPGVAIHESVAPMAGEPVVLKNYPNSFRDTNLKALLEEGGVEEVVLVGAMSHMCIDATSRAAADLGYKTLVVHDACATRDLEFDGMTVPAAQVHAALMAALGFAVAEIVSTADVTADQE